jgi:hypothetical protein
MATVYEWATQILTTAGAADWDTRGAPGRLIVGDPNIDWSNCCDGILGVEMARFDFSGNQWPSSGQYQPTPFGEDCASDIWLAEFNVAIVRCAPSFGPGDTGAAPTAAALNQSAAGLLADVRAVWKALRCADWQTLMGSRAFIGGWTPLPKSGNCAGYEIRVTTKVKDCEDCP